MSAKRGPLGSLVGVIALLALGALMLYGVQTLARNMNAPAGRGTSGAGAAGLHALAARGDASAIQRAAMAGADVNLPAPSDGEGGRAGMTPLMIACMDGNAETVRALLEAKARTETRTDDGRTALMYAAGWGDAERVQALIDAGARVDARSGDGWTPLMFAAARGDVESVRALVGAGADVNASNKWRQTALMAAARSDSMEKVMALLDSGASPAAADASGETALHVAASNDVSPALLELLVRRGAAVDAADHDGVTPLMRAAERADAEQVRVLLGAGASPTLKDRANGWTASDWAAKRDDEKGRAVLEVLRGGA